MDSRAQAQPSVPEQHAILVHSSLHNPQCCWHSYSWDRPLLLTGKAKNGGEEIIPLVPSLSTLAEHPNETERWVQVSVFHPSNELWPALQTVRGLQRRLENALKVKTRQNRGDDPSKEHVQSTGWSGFLADSERIFREFDSLAVKPMKATVSSSWSLNSAMALYRELSELESSMGSHVVQNLAEDLHSVTLQYIDTGNRTHLLRLDLNLSSSQDGIEIVTCTADLPKPFELVDPTGPASKRPRLDVQNEASAVLIPLYRAFQCVVESYQALWNELEDLDSHCVVQDPDLPCSRCDLCYRRLAVEGSVSMVVTLNAEHPRRQPESIRWLGKDASHWQQRYQQHSSSQWSEELSVRENLSKCLSISSLPSPKKISQEQNNGKECGICYTHELVFDDNPSEERIRRELPTAPCDNPSCARVYHESCLREWLDSLTTSRVSFDRIIGSCPYCKEAISASVARLT